MFRCTLFAFFFGLFVTSALARTLTIGDPAPKLQVAKWVQGEPVKEFGKGTVYIVEFWATWCGPRKQAIPHLNEIHKEFSGKGLVVIGQDVMENDEKMVADFVKQMGERMSYRVALDQSRAGDDEGRMAITWLEAANQDGIPAAFVVNQEGLIAWIGHPISLKNEVIEQILAGAFDVKKAAAVEAQKAKDARETEALQKKLSAAIRDEKWEAASGLMDKIEKRLPEEERLQLSAERYDILRGKKDFDGAYNLMSSVAGQHPDDFMLANFLAWTITSRKGIEKRDLALAEKLSLHANDGTQWKDPMLLDTLARAQFLNGKKDDAVATMEKAVALAEDETKDALKAALKSYKAAKLPGEKL